MPQSTAAQLAAAAAALVAGATAGATVSALALVLLLKDREDHGGRSDLGLLLAGEHLDDGAHGLVPESVRFRYF